MSRTDLLDGGGELQTQLDDSAFGGREVVGARQRSSGKKGVFVTVTDENQELCCFCQESAEFRPGSIVINVPAVMAFWGHMS